MDVVLNNSFWNEARTARLKVLHSDGLSFSLIAADIGATRSAAIAKARRLKLPTRIEGAAIRKPWRRPAASPPKPKVIVMPPPKPAEFKPEPGRDYRCTIHDLKKRSCRYPLWGLNTPHHERLYCGLPSASLGTGMPYCPQHADLCGVVLKRI